MKVFNLLSLTFVVATMLFSFDSQAETSVRIGTYNVLNPVFENKYTNKDSWDDRLPFIVANIMDSNCDIICLQEIGLRGYNDLAQNEAIRARYKTLFHPHLPSKPDQAEGRDGLAFFYNPENVELLKFHTSKIHTRPTHRNDFFADMKIRGPKPFFIRVGGTHLDGEKELIKGNQQLAGLVKDMLEPSLSIVDMAIVCGDFNEGQDQNDRPRYEIMHQAGFIDDGNEASTRPESLNTRHKGHIDWIYFKQLSEVEFELLPNQPIGDEKASDHKLLFTDLKV